MRRQIDSDFLLVQSVQRYVFLQGPLNKEILKIRFKKDIFSLSKIGKLKKHGRKEKNSNERLNSKRNKALSNQIKTSFTASCELVSSNIDKQTQVLALLAC